MANDLEIIVYIVCILIVFPLALRGLIFGMQLPPGSLFEKYFSAEKFLGPVGNVFLIVVSAAGAVKVALHYGLIASAPAESLTLLLGSATLFLLAIDLFLWARAIAKVNKAGV